MNNGCTQRTMVVITQNIEAPTIQLNAPGTIDCENPTVMINTNGSSNGADFDYQWYNEELTMIFPDDSTGVLISNPGMYFLEIVNTVNGCAKMDSVDVMANLAYPNIDAGNEQIIPCGETTVTLNGQLQNALPNVDVTWYDSDNNLVSKDFEPTVSETGWYYFEAENKDNACMSRDSVLVSLDPNMITDAVVELQSPQCYGEQNGTVRIVEVMSADQGLSYSLNGVLQSDANFGQLGAGNYELIISNVSGCNYSMQFEIEDVDELTLDLSLQDNHEIELGEQVQIEAFTNLTQNEIAMIEWSNASTLSCPDCLAPVATPLANTEYEILITDINGCLISRNVKILVDDELKVYLPNIFSPNQDGKNERFTVYGDRQVEIVRAMQVYNRWGNLVFTAEDFAPGDEEAGWDGKYQDNDVQSGVYVYRLELLLINGETKVVNGDLTIIR